MIRNSVGNFSNIFIRQASKLAFATAYQYLASTYDLEGYFCDGIWSDWVGRNDSGPTIMVYFIKITIARASYVGCEEIVPRNFSLFWQILL